MSMGTLAELARRVNGKLVGTNKSFSAVSTDTRNIQRGQLFVALRGPNFDGNQFVKEAADQGAIGALVDSVVDANITQIQVEDTRKALGDFACSWRNNFSIPVVAVTGSNGKTSIKQLLSSILSTKGSVLSTRGNLNNEIGLPLTLLDLNNKHWAAVVEMGANHHDEIAYLTDITRPTVGIISNANAAHLEGFGSLQGVAEAKGELFTRMPLDATAIINIDDPFHTYWKKLASPRPIRTFGLDPKADVSARNIVQGVNHKGPHLSFELCCNGESARIDMQFVGRHNVCNALAAAAAASSLGLSLQQIQTGLRSAKPAASRLNITEAASGARIIDDSYNANPASLRAGIELLVELPGEPWLVLGDMGELGESAIQHHQDAGLVAKQLGVQRLFACGKLSRHAVDAFGDGGVLFSNIDEMGTSILNDLGTDINVLVKASRVMGFERVVSILAGERNN